MMTMPLPLLTRLSERSNFFVLPTMRDALFSHLLTVFGAEKVSWFLMENPRCFVFFYCQDIKKTPSRGRRMVRNGAKQYVLPCETVCLAPSFNTSCRARQYFLQAHFDCFAALERCLRGSVFCKLL